MKVGITMRNWIYLAVFAFAIWPVQNSSFGQASRTAAIPPALPQNEVVRPAQPYSDLFTLTVDSDGRLRADVHIPPEDRGVPQLRYGNLQVMQISTTTVIFLVVTKMQPDGSSVTEQLAVNGTGPAGTLQLIEGSTDANRSTTSAHFMQQRFSPGARAIRPAMQGFSLMIEQMPNPANAGPRIIGSGPALRSPTFSQFLKEHPAETSQYLRPILEALQCESLIGPTDRQLVQLFPDAFKPDAATIKNVNDLLSKLDSDSPDERRDAFEKLQSIGPVAAMILSHVDAQNLSPEQKSRVDILCQGGLSDQELAGLRSDVDLLIDCLHDARQPVRAATLAALEKAVGHHVDFDVNVEEADRPAAVEKLRQSLTPAIRPSSNRTGP
jgi:hypothetical protein